ncbi:MAG: alpha/beta hydrolase [Ktedonobacteraceae bacterium]
MQRRFLLLLALLALVSSFTTTSSSVAQAATSSCVISGKTNTLQGTLQGANYTIAVPSNWNGTLALYSHGYVFSTQPLLNPAPDASDPASGATLLSKGYALAGSSYSQNGWALQQAFHDQTTLLNYFDTTCGYPTRTIAWGDSLGGIITAGLVQLYPERFTGALPMCGVLAGGIGTWNQALDGAFAFNVLLAGGTLPVVHITDPNGTLNKAEAILQAAQNTPQSRARTALVAALNDIPGWFDPKSPEPSPKDYTTQEQNQYTWESQVDFLFAFGARAELEYRAGGNPSWNVGVNYRRQLNLSTSSSEVRALYKQAGLNLDTDLDALAKAPRIKADPQAKQYLKKYITFNGDLDIPVLTIHTTGDGLVVNQQEQAYKNVVDSQGDASMLRQTFVHRAGHCAFTPAEKLTAFGTLIHRLNTGRWDDSTYPVLLNKEAATFGTSLNPVPPAFLSFTPTPFLRPYDARNEYW